MQRHNTGFNANSTQEEYKNYEKWGGREICFSKEATWSKVKRRGIVIDKYRGSHQQQAGCYSERARFPAGINRFPVFIMDNERIGSQRQNFVENYKGDHVGAECNPNGSRQADRKIGEVSRLLFLISPSHIPDLIEGGQYPKPRCNQGEVYPHGIGIKAKRYSRSQVNKMYRHTPAFQCTRQKG